jgi:hypothetical protein
VSRIYLLCMRLTFLTMLALSCASDKAGNPDLNDTVNVPWVQVCALDGSCETTGAHSLGCRSSSDTTDWDDTIEVVAPDTVCLRAAFSAGEYADRVTHIRYSLSDSTAPGPWLDANNGANRVFPPGSQLYAIAEGITTTLWVWVKDNYQNVGSVARTCIKIHGHPNLPPDTHLTQVAPTGCAVSLNWSGSDVDGNVGAFELGLCDGPAISLSCPDEGIQWTRTASTESLIVLAADSCSSQDLARHTYTLFVRAIDNKETCDPTPAAASVTLTTQSPRSRITYPELAPGQFAITSGSSITIRWEGEDADGDVVAYRYALKRYEDMPVHKPPPSWDVRWSPWSTQTQVTIDLTETGPDDPWSFYVQSKDDCQAPECGFDDGRNHLVIFVQY